MISGGCGEVARGRKGVADEWQTDYTFCQRTEKLYGCKAFLLATCEPSLRPNWLQKGFSWSQGRVLLNAWSHMHCNLSVTALWSKTNCNKCDHRMIKTATFKSQINPQSIGNQLPTIWGPVSDWWARAIHKNRQSVGDNSGIGWLLVGDLLPIDWRWAAIGPRHICDGLATGGRSFKGSLPWGMTIRIVVSCHYHRQH